MKNWVWEKLERFVNWFADQMCGEKDEFAYKHSTTPPDYER